MVVKNKKKLVTNFFTLWTWVGGLFSVMQRLQPFFFVISNLFYPLFNVLNNSTLFYTVSRSICYQSSRSSL